MGEAAHQTLEFDIFATVILGKRTSFSDYIRALRAEGLDISDLAIDILHRRYSVLERFQAEGELSLVDVPVRMLLPKGGGCGQIYTAAAAYGLNLCPAEVGPELLLQHPQHDYARSCLIGMEAVPIGDRLSPSLFCLKRTCRGLELAGACGKYDYQYSPDVHFIFAHR